MSADTERLFRRVVSLEDEIEKQNDFLGEVGDRLKRLEQPKPPAEKRGEHSSDEERAAAVDRFLSAPEFDEIIPGPLEKMTDAECRNVIRKVRKRFGDGVSMAKLRSAFLEEQEEAQ